MRTEITNLVQWLGMSLCLGSDLLNGCVTLGNLPNFSKLDISKTYGED